MIRKRECRSADGECSSSEPSLTEILEPPQSVPAVPSAPSGLRQRREVSAMQNIIIGRYADRMDSDGQRGNPLAVARAETPCQDYLGWVEPEDRSWIVFVRDDHAPEVYLDRDPATGAVLA